MNACAMVLYAGRLVYSSGIHTGEGGKVGNDRFGLCSHSASSVIPRRAKGRAFTGFNENIGGFHQFQKRFRPSS